MSVWLSSDPWSISRSWKVLEPGAAHMSSTTWSGLMLRKKAGIMETTSWRVMLPYSLARLTNSWMLSKQGRSARALYALTFEGYLTAAGWGCVREG
jgi:hypothetical protein